MCGNITTSELRFPVMYQGRLNDLGIPDQVPLHAI